MTTEERYPSIFHFKPKDYENFNDAVQAIIKKTKIDLREDLQEKLMTALTDYLADLQLLDSRPGLSKQKKELRKLVKATEKYLEIVNNLSGPTLDQITSISFNQVGAIKVHDLQRYLSFFQSTAENVLEELKALPKKDGRKKLSAERRYIKSLLEIYSAQTGDMKFPAYKNRINGRYSGGFYLFALICFKEIGMTPYNRNTFGKRIEEIRKQFLSSE